MQMGTRVRRHLPRQDAVGIGEALTLQLRLLGGCFFPPFSGRLHLPWPPFFKTVVTFT